VRALARHRAYGTDSLGMEDKRSSKVTILGNHEGGEMKLMNTKVTNVDEGTSGQQSWR
jgi:hypothetical protein